MALALPERLGDSRPRSVSKLPAESPGPGVRIGGRMMTPTKPSSADLTSSPTSSSGPATGAATAPSSGKAGAPGSRRPVSKGGGGGGGGVRKKKEAFVDPNVAMALAAALKAEVALAEFDAPPEILQEQMMMMMTSAVGPAGATGATPAVAGYHQHSSSSSSDHPHVLLPPASASASASASVAAAAAPSRQPHLHHLPAPPPHHSILHHPHSYPHHHPPPHPPQPLTPEEIRARAEWAAEFEVEHNWLLKEEAEMKVRKFDQTRRKLAIVLPEDDPLEGISNRLEEVQSMVKPKSEFSTFLLDLSGEQRDKILVS